MFITLRRMLMQICGLVLLYRGSRPATREGIATTLAALRQEHKDATDLLNELRAAGSPDAAYIIAAARYVGSSIAQLERSLARGGDLARAEATLPLLQRAQRLLLAVSDDQAGMAMVGFSHACCCAPSLTSH